MNNNLVSNFAERLKECLEKDSSLSATMLAENIGLSKQAISMYLSGSRNPKRPTVKAIAEALNVNEAWLMGYDEPMRSQSSAEPNANNNAENTFVPETTVEKKFVALFRSMGDETEEEKKAFEQYFETTIDMFLAKKGIILEDNE